MTRVTVELMHWLELVTLLNTLNAFSEAIMVHDFISEGSIFILLEVTMVAFTSQPVPK